nr:uncharacterized protein LOC109773212 isoform X2 [Aegilops tauschii subsp. strangulata]
MVHSFLPLDRWPQPRRWIQRLPETRAARSATWDAPPVGYGSSTPHPAVVGPGRAQQLEEAGDKRRRSSAPSTWTAATPPKTPPTGGALLLRMSGGVSGAVVLLEVTGVTAAVYGGDHKLSGPACGDCQRQGRAEHGRVLHARRRHRPYRLHQMRC